MARIRVKKSPTNAAVPNQMAPGFEGTAMQKPSTSVARSMQPVPRDQANIEAEKGETALLPDKGGLPAHFNIKGSRHTAGGTPLNVPKDTFIFSDTKKMRIKDPEILAEFGKAKGSWTPADLAKKYDINKFRKLVQDPDSDKIQVKTGEKMIANYELKLAKLALVQESKKGFPQGIPAVAIPYLATFNIQPDTLLPLKGNDQEQQGMPPQALPQGKYGLALYQNAGQYVEQYPIIMDPNQAMSPAVTPELFGPGQTMDLPPSNTGMWNTPPGNVPPVVSPQPDQWEHATGKMKYKPGRATMNPEDSVNWGLAGASLVTSAFNAKDTRKREEDLQKRFAADKIFASNEQRDRGDYTRNYGYFRPDQQGDGRFITKYGGALPEYQQTGEVKAIDPIDQMLLDIEESKKQKTLKKQQKEASYLAEQRLEAIRDAERAKQNRLEEKKARIKYLEGVLKPLLKHVKNSPDPEKAIKLNRVDDMLKEYKQLTYVPPKPPIPSSTTFGPGFVYTQPSAAGLSPSYDQSLLPTDEYMTGPPSTSTRRIRIVPATKTAQPAAAQPAAATAPVTTTSAGMTIQDYMKQYGVDEATATQLKNAE